jgi:c(7)-type cytochrome triheme protein
MKKFISAVIILCFIIPVLLYAQMEVIEINNPVFKSGSRSPVTFNHGNHMMIEDLSCRDCHHRFENGINVLDEAELESGNKDIYCRSCHTGEKDLKNAYHRSCIKCHDSMVKKNKASGPRLCGECHK